MLFRNPLVFTDKLRHNLFQKRRAVWPPYHTRILLSVAAEKNHQKLSTIILRVGKRKNLELFFKKSLITRQQTGNRKQKRWQKGTKTKKVFEKKITHYFGQFPQLDFEKTGRAVCFCCCCMLLQNRGVVAFAAALKIQCFVICCWLLVMTKEKIRDSSKA